jgi:hypothetical protein
VSEPTRIPAKAGDHLNWKTTLYHNQCGRRMHDTNYMGWTCAGPCGLYWKQRILDKFNDDAMATRFHTRVEPDTAEYAIVWMTEGKHQFTRVVPIAEAHKYERFVL